MFTKNTGSKKANMSILVFLPTILMLCAFAGIFFFALSSQYSWAYQDCSIYEGKAYENCNLETRDLIKAQNNAILYGVPLCCASTILVGGVSTIAFFVMQKRSKSNQENLEGTNKNA